MRKHRTQLREHDGAAGVGAAFSKTEAKLDGGGGHGLVKHGHPESITHCQ